MVPTRRCWCPDGECRYRSPERMCPHKPQDVEEQQATGRQLVRSSRTDQ